MSLNRVSGLLVLKNGRIALETYQLGNTERTRWMSMSVVKSITSTLIGAAIKDGHIASIDDPVTRYLPELAGSAYDGVTVRDVLQMASGVKWNETYTDPESDRRRMLEAQLAQAPGGGADADGAAAALPRPSAPMELQHGRDARRRRDAARRGEEATGGRPLRPHLGTGPAWSPTRRGGSSSPDGLEVGGSGFSATLRDYGAVRIVPAGDGKAGGEQILPDGWVAGGGRAEGRRRRRGWTTGMLWPIPNRHGSRRTTARSRRGASTGSTCT